MSNASAEFPANIDGYGGISFHDFEEIRRPHDHEINLRFCHHGGRARFLINQGHLPEESLFHDIFQKLLALSAKPLDDGQSAFQDQKELMAGVSLIDNDLSNAKMSDPTLQANWGKVKISLRY